MRPLIIVALFALTLFPVRAHLGEDRDQSIHRYGPVRAEEDGDSSGVPVHFLDFEKNGYIIGVEIFREKTASIEFRKEDGTALDDAEVSSLLDANKDGYS